MNSLISFSSLLKLFKISAVLAIIISLLPLFSIFISPRFESNILLIKGIGNSLLSGRTLVNGLTPLISSLYLFATSLKLLPLEISFLILSALSCAFFNFKSKISFFLTNSFDSSRVNCLGFTISVTKLIAKPSSLSISIIFPSSFIFYLPFFIFYLI